jgi:hypothetical protein
MAPMDQAHFGHVRQFMLPRTFLCTRPGRAFKGVSTPLGVPACWRIGPTELGVGRSNRHSNAITAVPLLTELPLSSDVRTWTNQILADLSSFVDGTMTPDKLAFGVLEGPPGTGKTLIAESLAATAGWSFVPSSVGSWFTSGNGAHADAEVDLAHATELLRSALTRQGLGTRLFIAMRDS